MSESTQRANPPPVDRLSTIWRRVRQHKVAQWVVAYIAVAYGLQHGVILASESLQWPNAVARISILLLVLGLPLVITFAWYHGARASRNFSHAELSILSALLVIASLLFYVFVRPAETAAPAVSQQASVTAARTAAADPHSAISLAVLPFVNLSSDKEQEFFSDGMTEEITAALAKVPDLRVVARTSAFEFKGKNVNIKTMGEELGATHLIEGSVRKSGNRLRITAELIKADDGTHIWAEDYDRDLTDIFAVQEDIARAITASLRMPLGLKPGENLVNNRNIDPELYQQYLRVRAKVRANQGTFVYIEAVNNLEKIVAKDPGFAPAWAGISVLTLLIPDLDLYWDIWNRPVAETSRLLKEAMDKAEKPAREAIRLDPRQSLAYVTLSDIEGQRKHWAASDDLLHKALDLDPSDSDILGHQAFFLLKTGRVKEALRVAENAQALEPLSPGRNITLGAAFLANNRPDDAIATLESKTYNGSNYLSVLAPAYAAAGQFQKSADTIARITQKRFGVDVIELAAKLMRSAPAKVKDPKALPPMHEWLNYVYGYAGANDRLLDYPERALQADAFYDVRYLFEPAYSPLRKTERFKNLVQKAGLVDYWRARGWPDLCHPTTGDDFACS
jgi:TolB-like protein